jgi:hypothetical protein
VGENLINLVAGMQLRTRQRDIGPNLASKITAARSTSGATGGISGSGGSSTLTLNGLSAVTRPAFISAEEEYFWSVPWQEDIRESLAAREAGDLKVSILMIPISVDPNDVVRWLLSHDDP